jgi:formamidopyrimidine-DNA glycosylase
MPELPEVETVVVRLNEVLPNNKIEEVLVLRDKSFQGNPKDLIGSTIESVSRRAKIISINLDNGLSILVHLKMTGQLIYLSEEKKIGGGHPTSDWIKDLPSSHTRIEATLSSGKKLFFNDMRVFGWWKVVDDVLAKKEFDKYGPDVNTDKFSLEYFLNKLQNRRVSIKQFVMDNKVVAGIGNIYASEALFLAGIHPERKASDITKKEAERLFPLLKKVIEDGIKSGGTTFDGKYVDIYGFSGSYQDKLKVYGQEGKPCLVCKNPIKKIKLGGRGSYYCKVCQK